MFDEKMGKVAKGKKKKERKKKKKKRKRKRKKCSFMFLIFWMKDAKGSKLEVIDRFDVQSIFYAEREF